MKFKIALIALLGSSLLWGMGCSNKKPLALGEKAILSFDGPVTVSYLTKSGPVTKQVDKEESFVFTDFFKGSGKAMPEYEFPEEPDYPDCWPKKTPSMTPEEFKKKQKDCLSTPEGADAAKEHEKWEDENKKYTAKLMEELKDFNLIDAATFVKLYVSSDLAPKEFKLNFGYHPEEHAGTYSAEDLQKTYEARAEIKNTAGEKEDFISFKRPISISGADLSGITLNRFERVCNGKKTANKGCDDKNAYYTGKMMDQNIDLNKIKDPYYNFIAARGVPLVLVVKNAKATEEVKAQAEQAPPAAPPPTAPLANNSAPVAPGTAADCSLAMGNVVNHSSWIWMMGSLLGLMTWRIRKE